MPPSLLVACEASLSEQRIASASTLSRHTLTFDTAYSLWWRDHWSTLIQELEAGDAVVLYSADASPQFGHEWFMQEITVIRDIDTLLDTLLELSTRLQVASLTQTPQASEQPDWGLYCRDRRHAAELAQWRLLTDKLQTHFCKHALVPTAMGSGRTQLAHRVHNALHAFFIDQGSWSSVQR